MDREKLEAASDQGIITRDQVESLLHFFDNENGVLSSSNSEEQLSFRFNTLSACGGDLYLLLSA